MDLLVNFESDSELSGAAVAVNRKRSIENCDAFSVKKQRCGMKKVAEILLVLSAMVKMRGGGRNPTDTELGLMEEARKWLVDICEELAPKDLVEIGAIGALIEDLGLNWKQKLGIRVPRLTISERFLTTKKKIEESKKYEASSPQPLQTGPVRTSTVNSGVLPGSHFGRDSSTFGFSRVENGVSSTTSYVPASSSANHPVVNAPTRSIQSQTGSLTKPYQENKVWNTANYNQAPPLISKHDEIAKIVQNILEPNLPEQPTWIPPSREYMNKPLTCQTCKTTANEVETVLICDGCEKGFHLKCLQPKSQKAVPRGEWHCARCLSLCKGKALPPKYGRVMRSSTSKPPSNELEDGRTGLQKLNPPKVIEDGRTGLRTGNTTNTSVETDPENVLDGKDLLSSELCS